MAEQHSTTGIDPGRQATVGMILLMLIWFGYCNFMMPGPRPRENQPANEAAPTPAPEGDAQTQPTGQYVACPNAHRIDMSQWPAGTELKFCPICGVPMDGHKPQTQPGATGPQQPDQPGTNGTPNGTPGENGTPPANGEITPRNGYPFPPEGTAASARLIAGPDFNTGLLEPTFSTRGAALHQLFLVGWEGQSGRNHATDQLPYTRILRPYNLRQQSFTVQGDLPGLRTGGDYLANAPWEFIGHEVSTNAEGQKVHKVTFRFPPTPADAAEGEVGTDAPADAAPTAPPFVLTKVFTYREDSYAIDVRLAVENRSEQPLTISNLRLNGPMGMETSYMRPEDTDEIYFAVDPATEPQYYEFQAGRQTEQSGQGRVIDSNLLKISTSNVLSQGYVQTIDPRISRMVVVPAGNQPNIRWIGQSVEFFQGAMFAPRAGVEGQPVPLIKRAVTEPFLPTNPNVYDDAARWVLAQYYDMAEFTVAPASTVALDVQTYVGPKKEKYMADVGLQEIVKHSYEWVEWIAIPLLGVMNFFHDIFAGMGIAGAWGIAIIMLTLLVRLVLLPVSYWSQFKMQESMAGMKRLQPKMEKLQKKHKDNKQKLQQEIIKLYREEGVSLAPMMQGCLLMLLQMPIWIALFGAFRYDIDFLGANFLWITDLSKPDALLTIAEPARILGGLPLLGDFFADALTPAGVFHLNILPILVMGLMFYQTMMTQKMQTATMDPEQQRQQKMMMGCMFVVFFFLFYRMAAGFNLYFLASTTYALIETRFIKKAVQAKVEAKFPPAPATSEPKKDEKK